MRHRKDLLKLPTVRGRCSASHDVPTDLVAIAHTLAFVQLLKAYGPREYRMRARRIDYFFFVNDTNVDFRETCSFQDTGEKVAPGLCISGTWTGPRIDRVSFPRQQGKKVRLDAP